MKHQNRYRLPGFNLVELLVVIAIVATLAAVAIGVFAKIQVRAAEVRDLERMRGLGVALHGWTSDHQGRFPRSSHSAFGHGELGWQREILPQLGFPDTSRDTLLRAKQEHFGIDETEVPARSPALNVYFELDPEYDDYEGAPKSWRTLATIDNPQGTVLLTMAYGSADHVMAQYFNGTVDGYPAPRPGRDHGCVLWVDGHVSLERSDSLFDATKEIDRFHPDKAR